MSGHRVDPAQPIHIRLVVGTKPSLPSYWNTFELTPEPVLDPLQLPRAGMQRSGLPWEQFQPIKIGEATLHLSGKAASEQNQ